MSSSFFIKGDNMSKKRYFALGLALGMTITAGVQVYAANGLNTVTS